MPNLNLPRVELTIEDHALRVHVARTEQERAMGLMHVTELPDDEGMLFICDEKDVQCFWMKDTPLPLSIAFLEEDGTIVRIADMEPQVEEAQSSEHPVRHVLEVNQGWFAERGVKRGMQLSGPPFLTGSRLST